MMRNTSAPSEGHLTTGELTLFLGPNKQVYINGLLHNKLKSLAVADDKTLSEAIEKPLWELLGIDPQEIRAAIRDGTVTFGSSKPSTEPQEVGAGK